MNLKTSNYYVMTVSKSSNITYMYTGDSLSEGKYYVHIRGLLKNSEQQIHTIIAAVVEYTTNIDLKQFKQYEHIVAISINEETPTFTIPEKLFLDRVKWTWF